MPGNGNAKCVRHNLSIFSKRRCIETFDTTISNTTCVNKTGGKWLLSSLLIAFFFFFCRHLNPLCEFRAKTKKVDKTKVWVRIYKYRIRWCISHPPAPVFHARYLHSWNSVGAKKMSALGTSRRELSEDVPFGVGTLLVVKQSSLGNCWLSLKCPNQTAKGVASQARRKHTRSAARWYSCYAWHVRSRSLIHASFAIFLPFAELKKKASSEKCLHIYWNPNFPPKADVTVPSPALMLFKICGCRSRLPFAHF